MSFRGGHRGSNSRGGGGGGGGGYRGRGNQFSRGGGSFGSRRDDSSMGPPAEIVLLGQFAHACEGEMICRNRHEKIPYFNAPIYLENKQAIGKVDEIFGSINEVYFTVKLQDGVVATSFKSGDKVFIGDDKLLPISRFLPQPKRPSTGVKRRGQGIEKRGFRGGSSRGGGSSSSSSQRGNSGFRGGFRGGSSGSRGGSRGFRGGNSGSRGNSSRGGGGGGFRGQRY